MAELPERKEMSKRKHEKHLFSFGSKKKPPEKVSSNVFYKKQVYINWFLVIIRR